MLALVAAVVAIAVIVVVAAVDGGDSGSTGPAAAVPGIGSTDPSTINEQAVQKALPSVVLVSSAGKLGSGIVFDGSGDIVTNAHVVSGARTFTITTSDGKRHSAALRGAFPANDLAVVHVDGADLKPARFGDSSQLKLGERVLAIGNPLGLRSSVTDGIVSAVSRTVSEGNGVVLPSVVQTSAAINPGNSGGALIDLSGAVVGIPDAGRDRSRARRLGRTGRRLRHLEQHGHADRRTAGQARPRGRLGPCRARRRPAFPAAGRRDGGGRRRARPERQSGRASRRSHPRDRRAAGELGRQRRPRPRRRQAGPERARRDRAAQWHHLDRHNQAGRAAGQLIAGPS
jgi:trypsin-like peptidase